MLLGLVYNREWFTTPKPNELESYMAERILVVEDDRRIRDLLRRGLIFEGYSVDTAEDGETALHVARETPPDAVIPVSYTHLDVYKRQWQDLARNGYTAPAKRDSIVLMTYLTS